MNTFIAEREARLVPPLFEDWPPCVGAITRIAPTQVISNRAKTSFAPPFDFGYYIDVVWFGVALLVDALRLSTLRDLKSHILLATNKIVGSYLERLV